MSASTLLILEGKLNTESSKFWDINDARIQAETDLENLRIKIEEMEIIIKRYLSGDLNSLDEDILFEEVTESPRAMIKAIITFYEEHSKYYPYRKYKAKGIPPFDLLMDLDSLSEYYFSRPELHSRILMYYRKDFFRRALNGEGCLRKSLDGFSANIKKVETLDAPNSAKIMRYTALSCNMKSASVDFSIMLSLLKATLGVKEDPFGDEAYVWAACQGLCD